MEIMVFPLLDHLITMVPFDGAFIVSCFRTYLSCSMAAATWTTKTTALTDKYPISYDGGEHKRRKRGEYENMWAGAKNCKKRKQTNKQKATSRSKNASCFRLHITEWTKIESFPVNNKQICDAENGNKNTRRMSITERWRDNYWVSNDVNSDVNFSLHVHKRKFLSRAL